MVKKGSPIRAVPSDALRVRLAALGIAAERHGLHELLALLPVPADAGRFDNDADAVAEVLIYLAGKKLIDIPTPLEVGLNLEWGSHPCQFYRTREEMLELVVPFFRQGLKEDEACVWISGEPLGTLADADRISCQDPEDWPAAQNLWLERALNQGYRGLRIAGQTRGERRELGPIGKRRIKALCLYSAERCRPGEVEQVLSHHETAYVKRRDGWERIPAAAARTVLASLTA